MIAKGAFIGLPIEELPPIGSGAKRKKSNIDLEITKWDS